MESWKAFFRGKNKNLYHILGNSDTVSTFAYATTLNIEQYKYSNHNLLLRPCNFCPFYFQANTNSRAYKLVQCAYENVKDNFQQTEDISKHYSKNIYRLCCSSSARVDCLPILTQKNKRCNAIIKFHRWKLAIHEKNMRVGHHGIIVHFCPLENVFVNATCWRLPVLA